MILIIGNNDDDLLYFDTIMSNKKYEYILKKYPIVTGVISNQPVILLKDVYTNVVSSMLTSYLIENRYILFIIKIGKVTTISKKLRDGDIVVSNKIVGLDVDITDIKGTKLGQIPGFSGTFKTTNDIRSMVLESFRRKGEAIVKNCVVLSANTHFSKIEQLNQYIVDGTILNEDIESAVFDSESFGISIAAETFAIPFVNIGVILNHIGKEFNPEVYVKILQQYSEIGKTICNVISQMGLNDVIRR